MEAAAESAVAPVTPPLPADVLLCIYRMLPDLRDFVHAACSSRAWAAAAKGAWQQKCRQRWTRGVWPSGDDPDDWWAYYKQRHQVDKEVEELLAAASFTEHQADSLGRIAQLLEEDAWDLVTAAANDSTPSNLSSCYWARAALFHLSGRRVGARLQQLLEEQPDQVAPAGSGGVAGPGGAQEEGGVPGAGGVANLGEAHQEGAPVVDDSSSLLSEAEDLTDLALQFVLLHHPLADVGALHRLLQQLAEETQRRMQAQAVDTSTPAGRRAALPLLNEVLFGPQPPAQATPGSGMAAAADAGSDQEPSAQQAQQQQPGQAGQPHLHHHQQQQAAPGEQEDASSGPDSATGRLWGRGAWGRWMEGPDLSSVTVPSAPYGLGLKGDSVDYYHPANSLLDHVLVERRGLPITLSLLYVIVGCRVGLPLRLFACPGHVIAQLVEPEVYIDAFEAGQLHEGGAPHGDGDPLTLQDTGRRMLRNLDNAYNQNGMRQVTYSIWGMPALRLKALRLRQEVAAISPAMQEVLAPQLKAYLMQLIRQAGEAELYAVAADMLEEFQQLVPAWFAAGAFSEVDNRPSSSREPPMLRADHPQVLYRVGDVITHHRYLYRSVITGWDPTCTAPLDWQLSQGVARLPSGSQQPFYHVLVDLRDRPGPQTTYVAQDNIMLCSERPPSAGSNSATPGDMATAAAAAAASSSSAGVPPSSTSQNQPVHHPDVGKYMAAWVPGPYDAAAQKWDLGWYTPAPWVERGFPQG